MNLEASLRKSAALTREAAASGMEFLNTDLDTALVFATIALQSENQPEKRERNRVNARKGFETISNYIERLDPVLVPEGAHTLLYEKLAQLRAKLEMLGESFS